MTQPKTVQKITTPWDNDFGAFLAQKAIQEQNNKIAQSAPLPEPVPPPEETVPVPGDQTQNFDPNADPNAAYQVSANLNTPEPDTSAEDFQEPYDPNQDQTNLNIQQPEQVEGDTEHPVTDMPQNDRTRYMGQLETDVDKLRKLVSDNTKDQTVETDLSPSLALVDSWTGSNLLRGYKPPAGPEEKAGLAAKLQSAVVQAQHGLTQEERQYLAKNLQKSLFAPTGFVDKDGNAVVMNKLTGEVTSLPGISQKPAGKADVNKMARDMDKDIDANQGSRGNISKAQSKVDSAERVEQWVNTIPNRNLTKREMFELGSQLYSLLSNGSGQLAFQGMNEMVPETARGNSAGFTEFFTGLPQGAGLKAFVDRMMNSIEREKWTNAEIVKRDQYQRLGGHQIFKKTYPHEYNNILQRKGLDERELDKNGVYHPKPFPGTLGGGDNKAPTNPPDIEVISEGDNAPATPEAIAKLRAGRKK